MPLTKLVVASFLVAAFGSPQENTGLTLRAFNRSCDVRSVNALCMEHHKAFGENPHCSGGFQNTLEALNVVLPDIKIDGTVAEKDGQFVGLSVHMISLVPQTVDVPSHISSRELKSGPPSCEWSYVGIKAEVQGQGIGRKLFDSARSDFKKNNCAEITTMVSKDNPQALVWHQGLGFKSLVFVNRLNYHQVVARKKSYEGYEYMYLPLENDAGDAQAPRGKVLSKEQLSQLDQFAKKSTRTALMSTEAQFRISKQAATEYGSLSRIQHQDLIRIMEYFLRSSLDKRSTLNYAAFLQSVEELPAEDWNGLLRILRTFKDNVQDIAQQVVSELTNEMNAEL